MACRAMACRGGLPLVFACAVACTAALAEAAAATTSALNEATPVGKVIELLDVLGKQLEQDGKADSTAFVKYVALYKNQSATSKAIVSDTKGNIQTLKTGLDDETTFQSSQNVKLEETAGELASEEKDLKDATERRAEERSTFEATESTLMKGIDQLQRSIAVLGKSAPSSGAASAASPASFAAVAAAKKLRAVFMQADGGSSDISLSPMQRETLDNFLREAARTASRKRARRAQGDDQSHAPYFLQVKQQTPDDEESGDYGEYTAQSNGVTATLQSVLDQATGELETARTAESTAKNQFIALEANLKREIGNKENTLSEIKTQITHSQEHASQMSAELLSEEELLKVTEANLVEIEAQHEKKSAGYKDRTAKRTDEMLAVREASQLLTSPAAQRLLDQPEPESFFQVSQATSRSKALRMLRSATSPGFALLSIKMHTQRSKGRQLADPFAKVKDMVRSLLEKLKSEEAQEAQHKAWCDSEMSKSEKSQHSKQAMLQKLNDRIGAMDAELAQLMIDIAKFTEDVADMNAASTAAGTQRSEDKARAVVSIQQYKDAQDLLRTAIKVLKKFYFGDAAKSPEDTSGDSEEYEAQIGAGKGVIGILEVALSDYADLQHDLEVSETEAEKDFKELMSETGIKAAVFEKDLEYRTRTKVQLEGDKMRTNADVKGYEKELSAVETYLEKLKEDCIGKAETYDERKTRREAELQSLKEALEYLSGQATP